MEKKLGWSTIFHELKGVVKAKIAQNNSQVSEGGNTVKPGQDSIHELIIWKVNSLVASVTCSRYQIAFKWSVNFKYTMRWKIFQWMKFLFRHPSNSRKLSRQKFHNELACVFTAHYVSKNADWNQQLTDGSILANRNSLNHLYCLLSNQKKVQILAFLLVMADKEMYHALFPWET